MKKQILFFLILFATTNTLLAQLQTKGIFVCNEGTWNMSNASIAFIDPANQQNNNLDFFSSKNGNSNIGDTPTDIKIHGNKVYVVVNVSSLVQIFDINTGQSLAQIPLFEGNIASEPRYIAFHENKAYVSAFNGKVYRIDTASLTLDGSVNVGRNPEGICVAGNKIYVANSGGLEFETGNYDHTVSVIDIPSFTQAKKIEVGLNPFKVLPDGYGSIYVTVRGNYNDIPYSLKRIDTTTQEVAESFAVEALNLDIYGKYAYIYSSDYSNYPEVSSWVKRFDLETKTLENNSFISDETIISNAYGINVNPANGDVYIANTSPDFVSEGDLLCFDSSGKLKFRINSVGVNPNGVAFWNIPGTMAGICPNNDENKIQINVYPNPCIKTLSIENAATTKLQIFNTQGILQLTKDLASNYEQINLEKLPSGIYLLKLISGNNSQNFKIIKR